MKKFLVVAHTLLLIAGMFMAWKKFGSDAVWWCVWSAFSSAGIIRNREA